MDASSIHLQHLMFSVEEDNSNAEIFVTIQAATSISTISSFELYCYHSTDCLVVTHGLNPFRLGLKHLKQLETTCSHDADNTIFLFLAILQNLSTLDSLVFRNLEIADEEEYFNYLVNNRLAVATPGRIKLLRIAFTGERQNTMQKSVNQFFTYILQSCPVLEEFILGIYDAPGALYLDFRRHPHLKYVKINARGCRYYIFDHVFGKQWKNISKPSVKEDTTDEEEKRSPFWINLAWKYH